MGCSSKKQPGVSFSSHFVQPDTFRPIAVGVRVGVNVAEWRTSALCSVAILPGGLHEICGRKVDLKHDTFCRKSKFH